LTRAHCAVGGVRRQAAGSGADLGADSCRAVPGPGLCVSDRARWVLLLPHMVRQTHAGARLGVLGDVGA